MNLWQLFKQRHHIRQLIVYAKLPRNIMVWDGDKIVRNSGSNCQFKNNWVVIPKEDYEKLRDTVSRIHGWRG